MAAGRDVPDEITAVPVSMKWWAVAVALISFISSLLLYDPFNRAVQDYRCIPMQYSGCSH